MRTWRGANTLAAAEVVLEPELLDAYLSLVVAFRLLNKSHTARFAAGRFFDFNFHQTLELGFAIHLQPVAELGVRCDNETSKREPFA